jgi:hypothetical protein
MECVAIMQRKWRYQVGNRQAEMDNSWLEGRSYQEDHYGRLAIHETPMVAVRAAEVATVFSMTLPPTLLRCVTEM